MRGRRSICNGPPIRLDILTIYDPHQLEQIKFMVYDGKSREGTDGGYRFKHPERKRDALLGIVKIL